MNEVHPSEPGHFPIRNDDVELAGGEEFPRRLAVFGRRHLVIPELQLAHERRARDPFILGDQDSHQGLVARNAVNAATSASKRARNSSTATDDPDRSPALPACSSAKADSCTSGAQKLATRPLKVCAARPTAAAS